MGAMGKHAAMAYGQLSELLAAGMPLPDALRTLAEDAEGRKLPDALERVADDLERGASAEEAFLREEPALGGMLTRVAAASEGSGKLPELLRELSHWSLAQDRIRRQIREALSYPLLVLFLTSALLLGTTVGIGDTIDKFDHSINTFDDNAMQRLWFFHVCFQIIAWIGLLVPLLWACSGLLAGVVRRVSRIRESLALRLPMVRAVARPVALTRFCYSVALLTKAGVPFHEAVVAAGKLSGFWPYEKEAARIAKRLASGVSLETVWEAYWLFPGTVRYLVGIGAKRGSIPQAFEELGKLFEVEAEGRARLIALLLPPLCLVVLGAMIISFFALGMLPMLHIMEFWLQVF